MDPVIRSLGLREYLQCFDAMRNFTDSRTPDTPDEIWLLQHPPVFTLGLSGRREHLLDPGEIPVVQADRGGQVTYHGPGQLVVYLMLDLKRRKLGVRSLVSRMEQSVIDLLAGLDIEARRRPGAPGVYVNGAKIAALGVRVRRGCSYHGLALNVDGDLAPFARINPCGYPGLQVTRLADLGPALDCDATGALLVPGLLTLLGPGPVAEAPAFAAAAGGYNRARP